MSWTITVTCAACGNESDHGFENDDDYPMETLVFECSFCNRIMDHIGDGPWKPTEEPR